MRHAILLLACLGVTFAFCGPAGAARPLRIGFVAGDTEASLNDAARLGAEMVRMEATWSAIARLRPVEPANPADPAYDWSGLDRAVLATAAAGLDPLVIVLSAPHWAERSPRARSAPPHSWRPDPRALESFARAIATRYSGAFTDFRVGPGALPRVPAFQVWNEPNLTKYLSPQWVRRERGWRPEAPLVYRRLLNAFYRGVKATSPGALVVTAGTAPYGDLHPGERRMAPARFVRELLCLDSRLRARGCPGPAEFDVLAHHPYSVGGPFRRARNRDDVSLPDIRAKLTSALRRAERLGTVGPSGRTHPVWVTEVSWDSRPPDPDGVPARVHAAWLATALYVLWRQGVDTVLWNMVRDAAPVPSYSVTPQSGVLLRDGRPKLAARAFRFPFVAIRRGSKVMVWARSPSPGILVVERRSGRGWKTLLQAPVERGTVSTRLLGHTRSLLRARVGAEVSLTARPR